MKEKKKWKDRKKGKYISQLNADHVFAIRSFSIVFVLYVSSKKHNDVDLL